MGRAGPRKTERKQNSKEVRSEEGIQKMQFELGQQRQQPLQKASAYNCACVGSSEEKRSQHGTQPTSGQSALQAERKAKLLALLWPAVEGEEWARYGSTSPTAQEQQNRLLETVSKMWADNTWRGYGAALGRCLEFCQLFALDPSKDHNACLWIMSTETEPQGALSYCKALQAVYGRLKWQTNCLSMLAAGLRHQGANTPIHPAEAISFEEVQRLVAQFPQIRLGIMIAWATASRWDEVHRLKRSAFIHLAEDEVIIFWGEHTKTSADNPFLATMYTVIKGFFTKDICREVSNMQPEQLVTDLTTTALDKLFAKRKMQWSGHSFKKGAANQMVKAAAAGLFPITLLPTVLKHQQSSDLASVTLRYVTDKVAVARALGTGQATQFL